MVMSFLYCLQNSKSKMSFNLISISFPSLRFLSGAYKPSEDMPPPKTIMGLSYILYEGLRCHCQGRIFLYPLSKTGTYNHRQYSTLGIEGLYGELTRETPGGLRPSPEIVERFIDGASLIQLIRSASSKRCV